MSLAITTTTPEGVVLAADSRQSFRNRKNMMRVGSDNASKIFQINNRVGVAVTGLAFLPENDVMKSIGKFIHEFRHDAEVNNWSTVKDIAEQLHHWLDKKYNYRDQLEKLPEKITADLQKQGCEIIETTKGRDSVKCRFKDPQGHSREMVARVEMINFMVAGHDEDGDHQVYNAAVPGDVGKYRDSKEKGKEYGATWIGQGDVVSRIVLGFDSQRIGNLNFISNNKDQEQQAEIQKQLRSLEYVIQWGTMTLQDAIDFCVLMIQTTSAMQRFSDGVIHDPGDMPGVGGPVDVAVITPDKGFLWINRKKLSVGDVEVNPDKEPDLK